VTEDMPGAVFLEDVIRGKCCCLRCGCRAARWLVPVCANLDVAGVGCEREQRSWVWARTMRGSELRYRRREPGPEATWCMCSACDALRQWRAGRRRS